MNTVGVAAPSRGTRYEDGDDVRQGDDLAQAARIRPTVLADNAAAITPRRGACADVLAMARLHPNPPRLPTR